MTSTITPRLIVADPDKEIAFYEEALGAETLGRHEQGGVVVHAELQIGSAPFTMAAEVPEWGLLSPESVGGSPLLLTIKVPDARATGPALGSGSHGHDV